MFDIHVRYKGRGALSIKFSITARATPLFRLDGSTAMEANSIIPLPCGLSCPQPSNFPDLSTATTNRCHSKPVGLIWTRWMSRLMAGKSSEFADLILKLAISIRLTKQAGCYDNGKRSNKPVDDERIGEGTCSVCYPGKSKTTKYCGKSFYFRLADMRQSKRDSL
jgi:hypothetical protein